MGSKKKVFLLSGILVVMLVAFISAPFIMPAMSEEEHPSWVWTKEYPKPSWWRWDETYWPTKPVSGGYYRSAAQRYIGLMNPNHWPVNDWVAMTYFYERLVYADGNYKPTVLWMTTSWEQLDPTTAVMHLRKGIKFHDGSTFNAESLKYQMEYIMDKKNGCWDRAWLEPVKSIDAVDEYTVKWHFKRPWAGFMGIMQNVPGFPMSAKALKGDIALKEVEKLNAKLKRAKKKAEKAEKKAEKAKTVGGEKAKKAITKAEKARKAVSKFEKQYAKTAAAAKGAKPVDTNPAGSGPYMLEEGRPGNYLKVKRNPNWWFGKSVGVPDMPYFDGIKVNIIPDPTVRLANLRAAKLDGMGVAPPHVALVKGDPSLTVHAIPQNHVFGYQFNHASGPCKDIRIRKAVSHAIDRKALIAGTTFGLGRLASCMYPGDHWTHNPNLKPVSYDPELSKKLLAEAGYPKGLTLKGNFGNSPVAQNIAEATKAMLAEVGIEWKVDFLDWVAIDDRRKNLDYDLMGLYWMWIWDPDLMATGLYHPDGGFNFGRSNNKKAIELLLAGRKEVDTVKRQKIYFELEKVLYDNYEDAWCWWDTSVTAYRKVVQGFNEDMYRKGREGFWFSHQMWFKEGHP